MARPTPTPGQTPASLTSAVRTRTSASSESDRVAARPRPCAPAGRRRCAGASTRPPSTVGPGATTTVPSRSTSGPRPRRKYRPGPEREPSHPVPALETSPTTAPSAFSWKTSQVLPGGSSSQARVGRARVERGQDQISRAAQVVLEGGVLGAGEGPARGAERGLVGVAVGLVERHLAVAVLVRGAEQAREERVGEEAALELVGLLAVLRGRAGGEEHRTLAGHPLVELDVEGRDGRAALHPGQRPGAAGVEHQQPECRGRPAHQLLQLGELEAASHRGAAPRRRRGPSSRPGAPSSGRRCAPARSPR